MKPPSTFKAYSINVLDDDVGDEIEEIVGTPFEEALQGEGRVFEGYTHRFISLNVSTKHISAYTPETVKEAILSLEDELYNKIMSTIDKVKGSGWSIYRFNKMYSVLHINKTPRAGSYIETPTNTIILNVD